jgi:hypothetical protein
MHFKALDNNRESNSSHLLSFVLPPLSSMITVMSPIKYKASTKLVYSMNIEWIPN